MDRGSNGPEARKPQSCPEFHAKSLKLRVESDPRANQIHRNPEPNSKEQRSFAQLRTNFNSTKQRVCQTPVGAECFMCFAHLLVFFS